MLELSSCCSGIYSIFLVQMSKVIVQESCYFLTRFQIKILHVPVIVLHWLWKSEPFSNRHIYKFCHIYLVSLLLIYTHTYTFKYWQVISKTYTLLKCTICYVTILWPRGTCASLYTSSSNGIKLILQDLVIACDDWPFRVIKMTNYYLIHIGSDQT